MLWLTANLNPRRSRLVVFPLIALAVALQVGPKVRDAYSAWQNPAAGAAYWRPALRFLTTTPRSPATGSRPSRRGATGRRTTSPGERVPLARGWFRQEDFPQNGSLYSDDMTPAGTRAGCGRWACATCCCPTRRSTTARSREASLLRERALRA